VTSVIQFIKKVEKNDLEIQKAPNFPTATPPQAQPHPTLNDNYSVKSGESDYLPEYYSEPSASNEDQALRATQYTYEDNSSNSSNDPLQDELKDYYENSDPNKTGQFRMTGQSDKNSINIAQKSGVRFETISNKDITIENQGSSLKKGQTNATKTTYAERFVINPTNPKEANSKDSLEVTGGGPNGTNGFIDKSSQGSQREYRTGGMAGGGKKERMNLTDKKSYGGKSKRGSGFEDGAVPIEIREEDIENSNSRSHIVRTTNQNSRHNSSQQQGQGSRNTSPEQNGRLKGRPGLKIRSPGLENLLIDFIKFEDKANYFGVRWPDEPVKKVVELCE
jgi:hypothetical protein